MERRENKVSENEKLNDQTSEENCEFFDAEEDVHIDNNSKEKENTEQLPKDLLDDEHEKETFDDLVDEEKEDPLFDDLVDEEKLKVEELDLTDIQLQERLEKAKVFKEKGNEEFKSEQYRDSILSYTRGLLCCPLREKELRSVLYSNRSAAKVKLEKKESALEDCSKSLENNPDYMKALLRRAKLNEELEHLEEALKDYTKIVELDPGNRDAFVRTQELPSQINERNEKLKAEMLGKLKDLGNMVLRPFGLSTNNFQLQQDPNSGGYSINFKQ